jgi:hypothetical protein
VRGDPVDRTRRAFARAALAGVLSSLSSGLGCGSQPASRQAPPEPPALVDPPRRPGRPLLLIAMPDLAPFRIVWRSLVRELEEDFDIATNVVKPGTPLPEFVQSIERERPRAVVVMDNPVLTLYRRHAASCPPASPAPPAVAVMTSFLDALPDLGNTTGVAYEVPGVTAFVQLRSVIARPVQRVAVIHRPRFRGYIERQAHLAAREQITLVPVPVGAEPTVAEIRAALGQVRQLPQLDALWVLNDNGLLRDASFLDAAWRPETDRLSLPIVVGLSSLAAADARFGMFAVVPDHDALGVQAAQLILKLAQTDWRADQHPIELPISTVTVANLPLLQRRFGLRPGAIDLVDRAVE